MDHTQMLYEAVTAFMNARTNDSNRIVVLRAVWDRVADRVDQNDHLVRATREFFDNQDEHQFRDAWTRGY